MPDIYELINKYNSLPKGNIYAKKINGREYFYHQYSLNGKKITKIVKSSEHDALTNEINERIKLEKEIKKILKYGNRDLVLSNNAKNLTGYVMKSNKVVASFDSGSLTYEDVRYSPLIINRTKRLEPFLKYRSIDGGRTNSRLLKKILNISTNDEILVSLSTYAVSISDEYWFKPKNSKLKYNDVCFNNDLFFNTALKGLITIYPNKLMLTPELTTNGSYEKGWKNINGSWWLYKAGNHDEIFSELFYSKLFEKLSIPTAHYEYDGEYILSKNFADKVNFEPLVAIVGDEYDIGKIYLSLNAINHQIALDYLRLCAFDVILNNVDRHNENTGVLRDKKTGKIISLAPNYDNNLSLISRDKNLLVSIKEGFLSNFLKLIKTNKTIKEALKEVDFPNLDEKIISDVLDEINIKINVPNLIEYILFRFEAIMKEINK